MLPPHLKSFVSFVALPGVALILTREQARGESGEGTGVSRGRTGAG